MTTVVPPPPRQRRRRPSTRRLDSTAGRSVSHVTKPALLPLVTRRNRRLRVAPSPRSLARLGGSSAWRADRRCGRSAPWRVPELPAPGRHAHRTAPNCCRPVPRQRPQRQGHRAASSWARCAGSSSASRSPPWSAFPLGLAIGASRSGRGRPPTRSSSCLRPVSPLAWFPIWLVVFKDAAKAAIWVIFITALWPIVHQHRLRRRHRARRPAQRGPRLPLRAVRVRAPRAPAQHAAVHRHRHAAVDGHRLDGHRRRRDALGRPGIGFFVWDAYNALNLAKVHRRHRADRRRRPGPRSRLPPARTGRGTRRSARMSLDICATSASPSPTAAASSDVLRGVDLSVEPGRVRVAHRPLRVRQVDAAERRWAGWRSPTPGWSDSTVGRSTAPGPDRAMVFQNYSLLPRLSLVRQRGGGGRCRRPDRVRAHRPRPPSSGTSPQSACGSTATSGRTRSRAACSSGAPSPERSRWSPGCSLLDEPFGALDALTRARLQAQLIDLWQSESETEIVLMVTHGIDEAILLSDRIVVMSNPPQPSVMDVIDVSTSPGPRDRVSIIDSAEFREIQERLLRTADHRR